MTLIMQVGICVKPSMSSNTAIRFILIFLLLSVSSVRAQQAVMESEPNDAPAEALEVAGDVTLIGSMAGNDQDAWVWTVSDVDARKRWTFELRGIPGRLTIVEIMRVEYAENGVDVVAKNSLMKMGTRDGSIPSIHEDLIFEPGEYLLGLAAAGGGGGAFRPPAASLSFGADGDAVLAEKTEPGAYRLIISEGSRLPLIDKPKSRETKDSAHKERLGREYTALTFAQSSWYQFDFDEAASQLRWDISAQVPVGRNIKAELTNEAGDVLASTSADSKGKLAFSDLGPPPGTWWVELEKDSEDGFIQAIASASAGRQVAGEESEPNGKWELANRVDLSEPLTGRFSEKGDTDFFRFTLDESLADQVLSLQLENSSGKKLRFCLLDSHHTQLQCRDGTETLLLPDLVLMPGDWGLSVYAGSAETEYSVTLAAHGAINPDSEAEPNDSLALASSVPSKNRIKGKFSGADMDYFRFVVAEEPQLWRFQVIGDGVAEVAYLDSAGHQTQRVRPAKGQRRVRLDNVYLLPGVHHLYIRGTDGGSYTVLARPLGPPDSNGEREPNDDVRHMQNIAFGQTRTGLLEDAKDKDYYRFFLANEDRIRLTIQPPADGAVLPYLYWYGNPMKQTKSPAVGVPNVLEGLYPPGDYQLSLTPLDTSEAEYTVSLERLDRFSCTVDCEPNDNPAFANPIPAGLVIEGVVGDWRDRDVYALPVRVNATEWTVKITPHQTPHVAIQRRDKSVLEYDRDAGIFRGTVPAGEAYYLFIGGDNRTAEYRVELDYSGSQKSDSLATALPAYLSLEFEAKEVAAYRRNGQRLDGQFVVKNESASEQSFELEAATSDYRWAVGLDQNSIVVAPGAEASVPVQVTVPEDAWADWPVRISARALSASGQHVEAFQEITAGRETAPANPQWGWAIPEPLKGGFNVAWLPLGSELIGNYDTSVGRGFEQIFDGVDVRGMGLNMRGSWEGEDHSDIVIELAGGEPVDVVGTAINLFNAEHAWYDLRVLNLALSLDGENFTQVLEQELQPIKTEQYFVLDEPVSAKYARLRLQHTFDGAVKQQIHLAEWKVIARPGADISHGQGFNLADLELGGHVVYSRPRVSINWDRTLLDEDSEERVVGLRADQEWEFVVGLHHNRASQITRLEWEKSTAAEGYSRFEQVRVAVSMESPHGPWTSLGTLDLTGSDPTAVMILDEAKWARFVKFTTPGSDLRKPWATPKQIRIWERPTDSEYRSILTEWGYGSKSAIFESLQELDIDQPFVAAGHDARERAAPLTPGQPVGGAVSLGKHEHWYQLTVPAGQNTLMFQVEGDPTVRTVLHFENEAAESIRLRELTDETTPRTHRFEAEVEPGHRYYIRVEEPPRNVVFSWDTSPSVLPYIPTIYNSLVAFTEDVVPGRDAVNLLPFGTSPLLRDWYGEPYILQTVLNDYLRGESSSDAERTLGRASRELAPLPGTKAIVVVTDATTTRDERVWDEFEEVRPRVFGIGVGGGRGANDEQDFFQDWTDVNAGHYKHMVYDGEMEIAFDRAATMLRRPAEYKLLVETEFREDAGPGTLTVVSGDGSASGAASTGAIELILDASGSMWQRLDGKFRIDIAKEVLTEAVEQHIPVGTPMALRVFGNREPNSCRTDLEIPLQPLDPASAATKIDSIDPQSLARTSIADSLAKIEGDLKNAEGRKTVVLVTDGEETCDGKPEDVIGRLRDKGFDFSLNIVGFAIGDAELEQTFADWAELGGGRYFSANDQEGLSEAITAALQVPYSVYDASGTKVATGMVGGEPLELEAGQYRVVVSSSPQQAFEQVEVPGGSPTTLELE